VEWVIRGAIASVVGMYVLAPLFTLAHELGHALPMRYGRLFGPYAGDPSDGLRILRILRGSS
jgi:hypothetical protein